jgi:hypothetical protein
MKIALVVPLSVVLVLAVPQAAVRAQQPYIQVPIPGFGQGPERREEGREHRERCERLEFRQRELRERLEHARYGEEREHTERELRETHEELEQHCRR